MTFEVTELKLAGIDERNLNTIHEYEEYVKNCLPASEVIKDMFIDVNREKLLSDLFFFTDGLMIEIPDFITFFDDKFHPKKLNFTIHPIKKAILFCTMKISASTGSDPRIVEVNFDLKSGATFSIFERKGNAEKLEYIARTYLIPNLGNG